MAEKECPMGKPCYATPLHHQHALGQGGRALSAALRTLWKTVFAKPPLIAAAAFLLALAGAPPCPGRDYLESFHNPPYYTGTVKVRRSADWSTTIPNTNVKLTVKDESNLTITVTGTVQTKAYSYSVGRKDGTMETSFKMESDATLTGSFSGTISSEFKGPGKGNGPDLWTAPKRSLYLVSGFGGTGTGSETRTSPYSSETREGSSRLHFDVPKPYSTGGAAYSPDSGIITGRITVTYYVNALSFLDFDLYNAGPDDILLNKLIPEGLKCPVTFDVSWNFNVKLPEYKVKIIYPVPDQFFVFGFMQKEKLEIPAQAEADPKKFEHSIRPWDIDPVQGSDLIKEPDPPVGPEVSFKFTKLPGDNNQFGKKMITADRAEPVTVRIFFNMFEDDGKTFASDNPGDKHDPNWFFYWKQGAVPLMGDFEYKDTEEWCGLYDPGDGKCYVGRPAARPIDRVTFNLRVPGGVKVITVPGSEPLDNCARTVIHELEHKFIHDTFGPWIADAIKDKSGHWWDTDRDGLPDWIEVGLYKDLGIRWNNPDTHGLGGMFNYRDYGRYGDQELLCWLAERGAKGITEKDWSCPGSQYK
jgi:hypothetical protein